MTITECINEFISRHEELAADLKKILKETCKFDQVMKRLEGKYRIEENDRTNGYAIIELCGGKTECYATIFVDESEKVVLLDTLSYRLSDEINSFNDSTVSQLKNWKYVAKLKENYGKYFDNHIYVITAHDVTKKVDYHDSATVYDYEDEKEAFEAARSLAKRLSVNYTQCFFLTLHKCRKRLLNGDLLGDPLGYYTISTKSKGETMRARRLAWFKELEVDEYMDYVPNNENMENDKKKNVVVMMNVIKLDNEGNLDYTLDRYQSKEEAREAAEKTISKWLSSNNFTIDEHEQESNKELTLCERDDYGNSIEVRCFESIAEIDVLIKEFEV